jgi:hypothetical protein
MKNKKINRKNKYIILSIGIILSLIIIDSVFSYSPIKVISEVLEIEEINGTRLYTLNFENGNLLQTTDSHPIYTLDGWKSINPDSTKQRMPDFYVQTLEVGDEVFTFEGYYVKIKSISFEEKEVKLYNLKSVSYPNNFFAEGVLVHNKRTPAPVIPTCSDSQCLVNNVCVPKPKYYRDVDGDGYHRVLDDGTEFKETCTPPTDSGWFEGPAKHIIVDCNDSNSAIYPGAPETQCDGIDYNCDGIVTKPFGSSCDQNQECCPGERGEGHCVQSNLAGDKFCRTSTPFCGDQYCDSNRLESCPGTDIITTPDITSCYISLNPSQCTIFACLNGCSEIDAPAGYYSDEECPLLGQCGSSWECDENTDGGMHCDGDGSCVSNCWDADGDGFGYQPTQSDIEPTDNPSLYKPISCAAQYEYPDCDDSNPYVYYNVGYNNFPPSSYCDCNPNTGNGWTKGTTEGPINLALPISQDNCFDGIDNDCDGPSPPNCDSTTCTYDCYDSDCSPDGNIYPIRNRTCGKNIHGLKDCTPEYDTELNYDRQCCPNPSDCVLDGRCVQSGDIDGEFPNTHYCYNVEWYGGDTYSQVCNIVVDDPAYPASNYSHWNLPGNAGQGGCCGDDPGEYFTMGIYGTKTCCDQPNMYAIGGECVGTLIEKFTWDRTDSGYCVGPSQCLVNPNIISFEGNTENATDINYWNNNEIRCIDDKEFIGDHYCNNGEWTTRTAYIATQLINFVQNQGIEDASIFCDNYNKVLNHYDYNIGGSYAEYYLNVQGYQCKLGNTAVPCTNNVCILKYNVNGNDKIVIGTSLNHDVNSNVYSILEVLGGTKTDCNSQLNSNIFGSCGTGVWYNNKVKSLIYSKDSISLGSILIPNWIDYLEGMYGNTINYLINTNPTASYDYSFASDTQNFNKIYISRKGNKYISIITEEFDNKKYMSAVYEGFTTNICQKINDYYGTNPLLVPFDCTKRSDKHYFVTGSTAMGYYDLIDDLGPKLRLQ